jgi:hypothetical protein
VENFEISKHINFLHWLLENNIEQDLTNERQQLYLNRMIALAMSLTVFSQGAIHPFVTYTYETTPDISLCPLFHCDLCYPTWRECYLFNVVVLRLLLSKMQLLNQC